MEEEKKDDFTEAKKIADKLKHRDNKQMTAEDFCEIMIREFPKTFDYWYKQIGIMYRLENHIDDDPIDDDYDYWRNTPMNFSYSMLYDMKPEFCNTVGEILIAATKK